MTLRLKSVLFMLLVPCLVPFIGVSGAGTPPPASGPVLEPAPYPSQAGSRPVPPRFAAPPGADAHARLAYWNELALRAIALDHTPPPAGPSAYGEQRGRTRTSRVMAIVHIAIYDALNAIARRYPGYSGPLPAFADSSPDAAIAQAAHDTLVALYPRQAGRLDAWLNDDLARLPAGRSKLNGVDVGRRAAAAILALRANDGSGIPNPIVGENYFVSNSPGHWRPDPVSGNRTALGAYWRRVKPFVIRHAAQFRPPPPPALTSAAYTAAFNEVRQLGGDGVTSPTRRTPEQTRIGIFWGYDDTAWLGTALRMYNQIAVQLAHARTTDALELARALALVNVTMADATLVVWEAKYHYDFWRPVTGVREASPGTAPTGQGDGNRDTYADPHWTPLGAPASNLVGPNFTPAFPSYPSGHAGVGGAMFQLLRRLYGDKLAFTFVSDEFNGITRDNGGRVRPYLPRSYSTLSQAEEEAGQSRIYLGVHWQFDKTVGLATGHRVADYVFGRGLVRPDPAVFSPEDE